MDINNDKLRLKDEEFYKNCLDLGSDLIHIIILQLREELLESLVTHQKSSCPSTVLNKDHPNSAERKMLAFDSIRDLDIINDELRLEDEDEEFYKKIYGGSKEKLFL